MAVKYIYATTTHGNCAIIRMDMTPHYDGSNSIAHYITPRAGSYRGWVSGVKGFYPPDQCFDTREEAEVYARKEIYKYRLKIISFLEKQVELLQKKMDKLGNTDPKVRYFNWIKNG